MKKNIIARIATMLSVAVICLMATSAIASSKNTTSAVVKATTAVNRASVQTMSHRERVRWIYHLFFGWPR